MVEKQRSPLREDHLSCLVQAAEVEPDVINSEGSSAALIATLTPLLISRGKALLEQKQYRDALSYFESALLLDPGSREAQLGCNRVHRKLIPRWHFEMLNDEQRNAAFERTLSKLVKPESVVLDIGSGSGLLAMMAARAGARLTISCEMIPPIAALAQNTVTLNGYDDRVIILDKRSTDIRVGVEMAERADLLVTETVDCGLLGEGIVPSIAHAKENLLTQDAKIIPRSASVVAMVAESKRLRDLNRADRAAGFDVSLINHYATIGYFPVRLGAFDYTPLTEPFEVFHFDFTKDIAPDRKVISVPALRDGVCQVIIFWFDMQLDDEVSISNHPNSATHWEQALQCLQQEVMVRSGEALKIEAQHDCSRVSFTLIE